MTIGVSDPEHRRAFEAEINALNQQIQSVNEQVAELRSRMQPVWATMVTKLRERQPEITTYCPDFEADEDPWPLFDSTRDYVEQVDCYKEYQGKPTERRPRTRRSPAQPRPLMRRGN